MKTWDKEIIKRAKGEQFRNIFLEYVDMKIEEIKAGIISWRNADMSKTKRNDRDIELVKLEMLEEIKNFPDEIITTIDNLEYYDQ